MDDGKEFTGILESLLKDESKQENKWQIKRYLIEGYIKDKDYVKAADLAEEISKNSDDEDLVCDMLFEKAIICRDYLDEKETAIKAFRQIADLYPENSINRLVNMQLKSMGVEIKKKNEKMKKESGAAEGFGSSNYPNPFNPTTTIKFSIPNEGMTELRIFNILGENIETLVSENLSAGTYSYSWDASRFSSGIYFYMLKSGNSVQTKRMMLVK